MLAHPQQAVAWTADVTKFLAKVGELRSPSDPLAERCEAEKAKASEAESEV